MSKIIKHLMIIMLFGFNIYNPSSAASTCPCDFSASPSTIGGLAVQCYELYSSEHTMGQQPIITYKLRLQFYAIDKEESKSIVTADMLAKMTIWDIDQVINSPDGFEAICSNMLGGKQELATHRRIDNPAVMQSCMNDIKNAAAKANLVCERK